MLSADLDGNGTVELHEFVEMARRLLKLPVATKKIALVGKNVSASIDQGVCVAG
jgi:hypothetical protein